MLFWSGLVLVALVAAGVAGGCALAAPRYGGPPSPHFDGDRFHNLGDVETTGFSGIFRWMLTRDPGEWRDFTDAPPGPKPPDRVAGGELRVTFVNHATVLIQVDGVNILTDPHWSERASPFSWIGPRRRRPPGLRFEDLPKIDAVLISHNHYDHLDVETLRRLAKEHAPKILVGLGNNLLLEEEQIPNGLERDWWQSVTLNSGLRITAVPVQHFSSRGLTDRDANLWTGWIIESAGGPIFFAGDTGNGPALEQVAERWAPVRLAILPIGAYRPEWFMSPVHISPKEAVQLHQRLQARKSVAIHFGTFPLADDGETEPQEELNRQMDAAGVSPDAFWILNFGEGRNAP
jgi:L-ascorbate metabolism protein UlaG (beta-lactamase superfamily)